MADFAARIETGAGIVSSEFPEATRRAKAFAAAARHSALVRFLRVALLGGALATVALLLGIGLFDPFGRLAGGVSIASIGIDGTKVIMEHPKLSGFRKDGRPYLINAQRAIQDALHPTLVELHGIDGDIAMAGNGVAHMTADLGLYDTAKEHMDVSHNVRLKSPQYDVRLKSASIDFKSGVYISKEPVTIVTNSGMTLAGDAISATDNGRELTIEGQVKTMIPPASQEDETKAQLRDNGP
jgi:lipopolysaccharide export system protein LptC